MYFKHKFYKHVYLVLSKSFSVFGAALLIMLCLGLFGYDYSIKNYISSLAVYFVFEEIKPFLLKLRGTKK